MTPDDVHSNALRHLIRILVFIDNESMMNRVVDLLQFHGYAEIAVARNPDELGMSLRFFPVDLLVSVSRTEHVFIGHFIHDLRHGRLECHPFPIVLMLLPTAEENHVRAVIDCGVDDLLVQPLDGDRLAKRLGSFILERRPFTVTHDYIGPNRRLANRPGAEVAPLIHVPNPVRARALGLDDASLQESLQEAGILLNRLKIQRDGHQVDWLLQNLMTAFTEPNKDLMAINELVSQLAGAATEIVRRTPERSVQTIRDQARKVVDATRAIVFTQEAVIDVRARTLVTASRKLAELIATDF